MKVYGYEHLPKSISKEELFDGEFISKRENLILYDGVGAGKTYLNNYIALNAITRFGHKVRFYKVAGLVNQLIDANQKGQLNRLMNQLDKLELLILEEMGYIPLGKEGTELLFQVVSMCYEKGKLMMTIFQAFSQFERDLII